MGRSKKTNTTKFQIRSEIFAIYCNDVIPRNFKKVIEKVGFRYIGEHQNHYMKDDKWITILIYEMLKESFESRILFKHAKSIC